MIAAEMHGERDRNLLPPLPTELFNWLLFWLFIHLLNYFCWWTGGRRLDDWPQKSSKKNPERRFELIDTLNK